MRGKREREREREKKERGDGKWKPNSKHQSYVDIV